MVIICHKYKFIVFKTYKTASTTIELFLSKILRKICKSEECIYKTLKLEDGRIINKHITPNELFEIMPEVRDYYLICSIRNPYTQIISSYVYNNDRIPTEEELKEYILSCKFENWEDFTKKCKEVKHLRTYYSYVIDKNNNSIINYFIKTETIKEDIKKLLNMFNIKKYNMKHIGFHRESKIKYILNDIISENNKLLIEDIFKPEIKLGNYQYPS